MNNDGPLYVRPKLSEMLQGLVDCGRAMYLEQQRIQQFYGYFPVNSSFWLRVQQLTNNGDISYFENEIREMQKKGL